MRILWLVLFCSSTIISSNFAFTEDKITTEIEVRSAGTDTEIKQSADWIKKDLGDVKSQNPNVEIDIAIDETNSEVDDKSSKKSKKNLLLAVTRTLINGTAVAWSLLIKPDVSLLSASVAAFPIGAMSGVLQYNSNELMNFYDGATTKFGKFLRWGVLEVGFLIGAKSMTTLLGISNDPFLDAATSILTGAALGVVTQGVWDVNTTEQRKIQSKISPKENKPWIDLKASIKTLAISAASVALNIAYIENIPHALSALTVMGVAGAVKYWLTLRKSRKCESMLFKTAFFNVMQILPSEEVIA